MFDKILEKLNKLNEEKEEFDFEDIEIEAKPDPVSKKELANLKIDPDDDYPVWEALLRKASRNMHRLRNKEECIDWLKEQESSILLKAYVLASLNYQVQNGGFSQWVGNGYVFTLYHVNNALRHIGTNASNKVNNMIHKLTPYLDIAKNDWNIADKEHDDYFEGEEVAEELDDRYYEIDDQFCIDIENYFRKRVEQEGIE